MQKVSVILLTSLKVVCLPWSGWTSDNVSLISLLCNYCLALPVLLLRDINAIGWRNIKISAASWKIAGRKICAKSFILTYMKKGRKPMTKRGWEAAQMKAVPFE